MMREERGDEEEVVWLLVRLNDWVVSEGEALRG